MSITSPQTNSSPPSLNMHPWALSNPIEEVKKLTHQTFVVNTLSKITLIAIAAIAISVLAVSLTMSTATGALPFVLFGLTLVTPCFAIGASKLQSKARNIQTKLEIENLVAEQFKNIKDWKETDVLTFFENHKISPPEKIHLPSLLPLIARFEARNTQAKEDKELAEQLLQAADIPDRSIRLRARHMGWQILEEKAIPAALEAAFILQVISNPFLQCQLSDIYSYTPKSFEERHFDHLYGPKDAYLTILTPKTRSLMLEDLLKDLSPKNLREAIFACQ